MPAQRKYAFFALITSIVCILAIYIHRHRQGETGRIDNFLISSLGTVQQSLFYFSHGTRTLFDHYLFLVNAKQEAEALNTEVGVLRSRVATLEEAEKENNRLKEALEFKAKQEHQLVLAHVVAHDVSSDYFGVRIDRGQKDGVRIGMGVISPAGVVGRVLRVTNHFSDVQTLIDPGSNIDSIIQRSRARGIVSGQAKMLSCQMKYLDRLEDVAINDTVLSSGYGDVFPKGLLVGYVTAVVPSSNGILQGVTVRSAVDIYRLEEVFVVFPAGQPEKAS